MSLTSARVDPDLTNLFVRHACRTDYDRACIGCECEGDDEDWRSCRIPERCHLWHAQHLHELVRTLQEPTNA